jgi:hypothetical protein
MLGTLIFYLLVLSVCLGLIYWSNENNTRIGVYIAYLVLIIVSFIRYDIGNDYQTYVEYITYIANKYQHSYNVSFKNGYYSNEPLFIVLVLFFNEVTYNYIWVLGVHFIISLFFLYKAYEENESHLVSILLFFISGMLFVYWDQVRQAVSISIIIYAIKYIKLKDFPKYLMLVLLAATAHYSALFLLPFYYVDLINPRKYIYITVIMVLAISSLPNILFEKAISLIPYWDEKTNQFSYVQLVSWGYKFRVFFYSVIWCTVIFYLPEKEKVLINFLFFGALIFILASGALNVMRMSFYFIFTMTLSIPIVMKIEKARTTMLMLMFGYFLFFVRDVITDTGTRGCVPYVSVFSEQFPHYFRSRGW